MDDIKKMLRSVINGQSALKQELLAKIGKLDKKVDNNNDSLRKDVRDGFEKVNKRLDSIGKSVAFLEDDSPTIEEFDELESRATKLEGSAIKN